MSNGRALGLDFGQKTVGVALGGLETKIATPFLNIQNKGNEYLCQELFKIIKEWGIDYVVFGSPLNMNEKHIKNFIESLLIDFVAYFKEELKNSVFSNVKIEFFDERLSTFQAKQLLSDLNSSYKEQKKQKDMLSAQIILSRWFENKDF